MPETVVLISVAQSQQNTTDMMSILSAFKVGSETGSEPFQNQVGYVLFFFKVLVGPQQYKFQQLFFGAQIIYLKKHC